MMNPTHSSFNHIVAFEVAKEKLVVHVLPGDEQRVIGNRPSAVKRLLCAQAVRNRKAKLGALLVVCEATGGYERHVLEATQQLGLACHRAHGARVRFFANYLGLAAKTDPIDARVLALYGLKTEELRLYAPPAPEVKALRALKARREEIQQMLFAENNRLEHATHRSVLAGLKMHIRALKAVLAGLDKEIAELVRHTPLLAHKTRLMQSLVGVGPVTATALLAYLPELGNLTRGEAARLAGLAPINNDSGKTKGSRPTRPGRDGFRRSLYMAAGIAMHKNPKLIIFAARLKTKGKPFKLVVTAVMRKLVVILNAVLRDDQVASPLSP
jgi:transposase